METRQRKEYCLNVVTASPACYLSTINEDGFPDIRAMLNLRNPVAFPGLREFFDARADDLTAYLTTNASSMKIRQALANPKAALYYCVPEQWRGVTLQGFLEIVDDPGIKRDLWQRNWTTYYPQGLTDPDFMIVRLSPKAVKAYGNLSTFTLATERA